MAKQKVIIKGNKDGLVFHLDDSCELQELLTELKYKLDTSHQKFLYGPIVHVHLKLGKRKITEQERDQLSEIVQSHGNLIVSSIVPPPRKPSPPNGITPYKGIVRSGQNVHVDGHLFVIGEVNPGGTVTATGDIYVMGALRGIAHAGMEGELNSIIAASLLRPTQLRIADCISRPPDEWGIEQAVSEFAYLLDGQMKIDKISNVHRIRPETLILKED